MKKLTRTIILTTISIAIVAYLVPQISVANLTSLILVGTTIGLLNLVVRPVLKMVFLPINLLTLGIFNFLLNIGLLYLALWLVPGVSIGNIVFLGWEFTGFWALVFFSFALSLTNSLITMVI